MPEGEFKKYVDGYVNKKRLENEIANEIFDDDIENAKTFLGRPFDHYFDRSETDAIYCTELIDLALKKTAPGTALKVTDDVILPEACLDETLFTEIPIRN